MATVVDELKESTKKLFTKEQLGQYWNDLYKDVENCRDFHFVQRLEIVSRLITERFPVTSRVLDIGCGAGVLTERLVAAGFHVDAADMSPDMLEYTKKRLEPYDASKYSVFQAELKKIPADDDSFDVVACIGVFGYMEDVDSAIRELKRVLRPGGTLVMSIRNVLHVTVFDGLCWLKAPVTTVPKMVWKKVAPRLLSKGGRGNGEGSAGEAPPPESHAIDIFDKPRRVQAIFESFGFALRDFQGAGYGPPTFSGRPVVTQKQGKRLSEALAKAVNAAGLQERAKWLADISVYVFEKLP